ncbi:DUF1643 domain-containing protein [Paraflavisolibacter sp. H34]|uniref:DUF1643 domain-containing protein n=1 Tax=Huijunlia imazamoxiresistens TaxID=3127457 RepID=UPI003019C8EE
MNGIENQEPPPLPKGLQCLGSKESGALFSPCGSYRYALWRTWDSCLPWLLFIGLNPSKATEGEDDPTIRRVIGFAQKWGYGGVYMANIFAYVTTYPRDLRACPDPVGQNDGCLQWAAAQCKDVIFAWGKFPGAKARAREATSLFPHAKALVINKDGSPRHPLYVPGNVEPVSYCQGREQGKPGAGS